MNILDTLNLSSDFAAKMAAACCFVCGSSFSHSKNYKYFSTPKTNQTEKEEAVLISASFTKKYPVYFEDGSITHKMHLIGFVIPKVIRNDKSDNIMYKIVKVEQAGEKLHQKWNTLDQTRFLL